MLREAADEISAVTDSAVPQWERSCRQALLLRNRPAAANAPDTSEERTTPPAQPFSPCVIRATGLGCLRTRRMPSRHILRAVRTFGNGDKVPGIVAVQATAVHHVGRDLLLRFAHSKLMANQMTGHDCGLG
jgi:hypothetical protein